MPNHRPIAREAEETVRTLLGATTPEVTRQPIMFPGLFPRQQAVAPRENLAELMNKLLWLVPGDTYRRIALDLSKVRRNEKVFDARGRGRSITILRSDTDTWTLSIDNQDPIPGSELPVGSIIVIRQFREVFVSNPAGTGTLAFAVELTSWGE